jgi:hypothetical protein
MESSGAGIWTVVSDDLPLSQLDTRYGYVAPSVVGADDALAINALFAAGKMILDGNGQTFNVYTSIVVPANAVFRNAKVVHQTAGMNGVKVNTGSKVLRAWIYGTGTIGTAGAAFVERGIYPAAANVTDVELDVLVENMTFGAQINDPTGGTGFAQRWYGNVTARNIPGYVGQSEGYGVLMSGCSHSKLNIQGYNVQRHVAYLSNGASDNIVDVIASGVSHCAVNMYSTPTQAVTRNNKVTLVADNVQPGLGAGLTWAVALTGGVSQNDITVLVRDSTCDGAAMMQGQVSGGNTAVPQGNTIVVHAYGTGFIGDIIQDYSGAENTVELYGSGTTSSAAGALIASRPQAGVTAPAGARYGIHIKYLNWDAKATSLVSFYGSRTDLRTDIGKGVIKLYNSTNVTANLTDSTGGLIDGYVFRESRQYNTASLAAGASQTNTLTLVNAYYSQRRPTLTCDAAGVSTLATAPTGAVTSMSSGTAVVIAQNNLGSNAVVTVRFAIEGY